MKGRTTSPPLELLCDKKWRFAQRVWSKGQEALAATQKDVIDVSIYNLGLSGHMNGGKPVNCTRNTRRYLRHSFRKL
jgi:hypothetical protein